MTAAPTKPRRWFAWSMLLVAIVSGAVGTSALSRTNGFTVWEPTVLMGACYAACFLALTQALRVIPMSIAYAVWSGVGIALVSVIAWVMFDQPLNAGELLGIGLILVGAVVIQLYSRSTHVG
jgi:small multidrug resistance pump